MTTFSERYGYTAVEDIVIKESMPETVCNTICTALDNLEDKSYYYSLNYAVWVHFMNKRKKAYDLKLKSKQRSVCCDFFSNSIREWFTKMNLLEFILRNLERFDKRDYNKFVEYLNKRFSVLKYGYRICDTQVIPITSDEELEAISLALKVNDDNIRNHLNKAITLYSDKVKPDYANSIKESISAVEACCRRITGESTLGEALKKLENKNVLIPRMLKSSFEKLYYYTNAKDTGIRHALMDETGEYVPKGEEALYMLVTCSAFVSYLLAK